MHSHPCRRRTKRRAYLTVFVTRDGDACLHWTQQNSLGSDAAAMHTQTDPVRRPVERLGVVR